MFLLSFAVLCGAVILLFLSLLQYRNPKQTFLKRHPSIETFLSLLLTGLFAFGSVGLFVNPVSVIDLVGVAVMAAATVVFFKVMKVKDRLTAYAAEKNSGVVIIGDFKPTTPTNKPEPSFRKAA